ANLQVDGDDDRIRFRRAALNLKMRKQKDALADYAHVIENNPNDDEAYKLQGDVYYEMGRFDNAVKNYSKALSFKPEGSGLIYAARANAYRKLGRYDLAAQDAQSAQQK
ncbi:MAG: tetratricopeptide repeat protein, partial [Terriglobales bacterium]